MSDSTSLPRSNRESPINMSPETFRQSGHKLIDELADFFESLPSRSVTNAPTVAQIRELLGDRPAPSEQSDPSELLRDVTQQLLENSLFNGHPRFWGYVTSSATPIGALADLLASTINQNVGAWQLSPMASEIEIQVVRWIAEFVGYPSDCGGLMVSGGNMANFIGFLAARRAKVPWDVRESGLQGNERRVRVYCSSATHTWMQSAADLFGLGIESIRWIDCDLNERMDTKDLERKIIEDKQEGLIPIMVSASCGTVGTGAVDPINAIADICEAQDLWFHIDGAYGAMAAQIPDASEEPMSLHRADSLALDPHKWLYSPLEAGCALVRNAEHLPDTFDYRPSYYKFDLEGEQPPTNFYGLGMQNSRGFRALKVWLAFKQIGTDAFKKSIAQDITLSRAMAEALSSHPEIEVVTCQLSIVTFRFVPSQLDLSGEESESYLNKLNDALLEEIQAGGEAYVSNAVLQGMFVLRACIVNFRTTLEDVQMLPLLVAEIGNRLHAESAI